MKWNITTFEQLDQAIAELIPQLPVRCLLLLKGSMASGKTTFVRKVVERFGIKDANSPTFALHQSYQGSLRRFEHFDLYRIENPTDLETCGLWDLLSEPKDSWIFIEWPERLDLQDLPPTWPTKILQFELRDDGRTLTLRSK